MPTVEKANIAVLIDAENVDPSFADQIFSYARSLGVVTIREIYGSGISLNEWSDAILENTIHTNFTLRPNRFKNSSDISLVIGAMEVLFSSRTATDEKNAVAAVVIASSDSDFSPLAVHLRSAGIDVIGMGEPGRINPMWPRACTEFVELEQKGPLVRKREECAETEAVQPEKKAVPSAKESSGESEAPVSSPVKGGTGTADVKRIATTHPARVKIIKAFITEQITVADGRIKSGQLFKALSTLPDYQFDQQRSRRNPLDYLERQYSDWFVFEPGENGSCWISLRNAEQQTSSEPGIPVEEQGEEAENSAEEQQEEQAEQLSLDVGEPDDTPPAEERAEPEPLSDDPRVVLISAGIPVRDAGRTAEILSGSKNLFAAYHSLTKAFGRKQGGEYYRLIKEYAAANEASLAETQAAPAVNDETPAISDEANTPAVSTTNDEVEEDTGEHFLIQKGLPADVAAQIVGIVKRTPNLRVAYNELRKAFGAAGGRKYLALVKEHTNNITLTE